MEIKIVQIDKPEGINVILGQSHFVKTVEDVHEAMVNSVPGIKFGVAFCEASDKVLVRASGTDEEMVNLAKLNAYALSAGHSFVVFMRDAYPINVLRAIKDVPEVCSIFAATANALQVLIAESEQGRGIIGVIDGQKSKGIETAADAEVRKQLLRKFGYKA